MYAKLFHIIEIIHKSSNQGGRSLKLKKKRPKKSESELVSTSAKY